MKIEGNKDIPQEFLHEIFQFYSVLLGILYEVDIDLINCVYIGAKFELMNHNIEIRMEFYYSAGVGSIVCLPHEKPF